MKARNSMAIIPVMISILLLCHCSPKRDQTSEILRPVRYEKVIMFGGEQTRTFSGVSKSGLETNLSFKVGGTISRLNVKVGDQVRGGQLLATLDAMDYNQNDNGGGIPGFPLEIMIGFIAVGIIASMKKINKKRD